MHIMNDPYDPYRFIYNDASVRYALDGRRAVLDAWYAHLVNMPNGLGSISKDIHCVFYVINANGLIKMRHVSGDMYSSLNLPYPDPYGYIEPNYKLKSFINEAMQKYLNHEMTT